MQILVISDVKTLDGVKENLKGTFPEMDKNAFILDESNKNCHKHFGDGICFGYYYDTIDPSDSRFSVADVVVCSDKKYGKLGKKYILAKPENVDSFVSSIKKAGNEDKSGGSSTNTKLRISDEKSTRESTSE